MAEPFLYLASPCHGGLVQAACMRSVLALRAACAEAGVALQLDLGGGEALISRARAGMLARFLASHATHLLFVDTAAAFDSVEVLRLIAAGEPIEPLGDHILLIRRDAAQQVVNAYPELQARLGDVRDSDGARVPMVFETILDAKSGAYIADLADLAAFTRRWRCRLPRPES
ncbi:MAG: uncharacterized protein JWP49_1993 [Phenylobacterium sp.]|nr:uncharacterized protein [Phenylobacterium sp.]